MTSDGEAPRYEYDAKLKRFRDPKTGQLVSAKVAQAAAEAKSEEEKCADINEDNHEPVTEVNMTDFFKIKLPDWNLDKPTLWFKLCEDIFTLAKVPADDQAIKAVLIQRALPKEVIAMVEAFFTNPNAASRYDDLKRAVLGQHVLHTSTVWFVRYKGCVFGPNLLDLVCLRSGAVS